MGKLTKKRLFRISTFFNAATWPQNTSKPGILSNHWSQAIEPMGWLDMQICCEVFVDTQKGDALEILWRNQSALEMEPIC